MPRRRHTEGIMAGATAQTDGRENPQACGRAEPLPSASERQAEMERILGLKPHALDAEKCALRERDYLAAQGAEVAKFWKGV